MKLLVFAHTPPPFHGQSYMVKLMLDDLGGDHRQRKPGVEPSSQSESGHTGSITKATTLSDHETGADTGACDPIRANIECYHVNSRFSRDMEDIGEFRMEKLWLLLFYCFEALWCRFRYGARYFYYVPAPGKRAALYRDWIVMLVCRPFFKGFVYHWHAVGLGDWLHREGTRLERWITHALLGRVDLSIVLAISSMRDALWFKTKRVEIVPNGIPDPCPDFEKSVLPLRQARVEARRKLLQGEQLSPAKTEQTGGDPHIFKGLYLAHCTREKGLFDALDAVAIANAQLAASNSAVRICLTVAGAFLKETEEAEFQKRIAEPDLNGSANGTEGDRPTASLDPSRPVIKYVGFVSGADKERLLRESDWFCFPTYYPAEGQPVNIIEAMAFGMTVVTTRWRAIAEILPSDYIGFVPPQSPDPVAQTLKSLIGYEGGGPLRERFTSNFVKNRYTQRIAEALHSLEVGSS